MGLYAVLAVRSYKNLRKIEKRYPASGEFLTLSEGPWAGTRLHFVTKGTGKPVVLLHGNDGSLADYTMSPLFDMLAQKYQVCAFDRPGHSYSTASKLLTPQEQAEVFHQAFRQLRLESPIVVAHSWAGTIALHYALKYQKAVSGLVLVAACIYPDYKAFRELSVYKIASTRIGAFILFPIVDAIQRTKVGRLLMLAFGPTQAPKGYIDQYMAMLFRPSQVSAACFDEIHVNNSLELIERRYSELKIPIQIVSSDRDPFVPSEQAQRLAREAPNATCTLIPNAAHELMFSHPELLVDAVKSIDVQLCTELSEIIGSVDTPAGKTKVREYLASQAYPHYEDAPEHPGFLVRTDESGEQTVGKFVNKEFRPLKEEARE